jgi:putative ABC transport system permease protein
MWTLDALGALALTTIPRADEIALRPAVLLFAVVVTMLSAVVSGVMPALGVTRVKASALRTRDTDANRGASRSRDVLVIGEVALAMMLLVAAGLMTQSFMRLQGRNLGFDPERLLMVQLAPPREGPSAVFYESLIARLAALPGVASAAGGSSLPFAGPNSANVFGIEGREFPPGERPDTDFRIVTPEYFTTLAIPLLRGRTFTGADTTDAPAVIVNATLARRFLQGDPIGQRLRFGEGPWMTVVGVAADTRYLALDDPRDDVRPMMYLPYGVRPVPLTIALRMSTPPETLTASVRRVVASIAPEQPIARLETMENVLATTRGPQRFNAAVLGAFAWIALVLAAAGLWGLIAHGVSQRTHEIGVRVALGARPSEVLRMIAWRGVWLAFIGIALGLAGSAATTGLLQRVLFDTAATDPATFTLIALVFLGIAVAASVLPARRALRIDPVQALRSE